jgi:hypothetical protein
VIINRRSLLAAIGLSFPALAGAEAATQKKKPTSAHKTTAHNTHTTHKPKSPSSSHKVAARKPHHTTKPAPTKS